MDMEENKRLGDALISLGEGNFDALHEITSRLQKLFYVIANTYYPSKADVEDAVQDFYLVLIKKAKKFKRNQNAKGWIVRVFNNLLLSKKRKEQRELDAMDEYARAQIRIVVDEKCLDMHILFQEIQYNLSPDEWMIFKYSYWYGYTVREIAKLMHKSKSTIDYKLNKIEKKVHSFLDEIDEMRERIE